MRATQRPTVGAVLVVAYAALLVYALLTTSSAARPDVGQRAGAAQQLVDAWARSRSATFVTIGTFERRSDVTGSAIGSEDVVAQRPPRRIHRQLGGVEGRDDDRLLVCPAPPQGAEDERQPCRYGDAGGLSYAESVAREVEGLRSIVAVDDPLYDVERTEDGCFELDLRRVDPRAPFGVGARFCFDDATGAPTRREVRYEGGISETVVVEEIRSEVSDADLEP